MASNSYGWASPSIPQYSNIDSRPRDGGGSIDPGYSGPTGQGRPRTGGPGDYVGPGGSTGGVSDPYGSQGILDRWMGRPGLPKDVGDWANPHSYGNEGFRNMMEGYSSLYAIPMFNAALARETQDYNRLTGDRNFGEQQWLNRQQNDLAYRGSNREDLALSYGQQNNTRDFGEMQRQFNVGQGNNARDFGEMQRQFNTGQFNTDRNFGEGQRQFNTTFDEGQRQYNTNFNEGQRQFNTTFSEGQRQFDKDWALQQEMGRGNLDALKFSNDTTRMNYQNQFNLGNRSLDNERFMNQAQAQRLAAQSGNEQFANQTSRDIGMGQLGFQGRELDVNEAFRRSQLAQDADLTREKFRNDLLNTRMATQGRAAGPNQRAVRSWY